MKSCDHTLHAIDDQGRPTGSWMIERSEKVSRVVCGACQKFYGYLQTEEKKATLLRQAYLEQQRRLSCPAVAKSRFLDSPNSIT